MGSRRDLICFAFGHITLGCRSAFFIKLLLAYPVADEVTLIGHGFGFFRADLLVPHIHGCLQGRVFLKFIFIDLGKLSARYDRKHHIGIVGSIWISLLHTVFIILIHPYGACRTPQEG